MDAICFTMHSPGSQKVAEAWVLAQGTQVTSYLTDIGSLRWSVRLH